jgi:hypothetical protein
MPVARLADSVRASGSIDVIALIAEAGAFLQELKALGDTTHPKDLFARHGGDKFVDCVLVSENERNAHAGAVCFFDSTIDRIRHLQRTRAQWQDAPRALPIGAVSRWNTRDHAIYEDLVTCSGKASAVVVESTTAGIGLSVLRDYIVAQREYPEATPCVTVLVTGAQKTTYGCSAISIGCGFDLLQAGKRAGLDAIHARQLAQEKKTFRLVIDLTGTHLHWSSYRQAQSRTHIEEICRRHGPDALRLDNGEALLEYHDRHRVTQDVTDQETRQAVRKTFSNAVDRTRIARLERLIAYLNGLVQEHGADEAGILFAEKLARIKPSHAPHWDAGLRELRKLAPSWEARKGLREVRWKTWTTEQKLTVFAELLNTLPQWRAAPSVRRDALVLMAAIYNDLLPQAEALQAELFAALAGVPQAVAGLAAEIREQKELDYLVWLLYAFLGRVDTQERCDSIRALLPLAAAFGRAGYRLQFVEVLAACTDDAALAAEIEEAKHTVDTNEVQEKRYRLCYGCGEAAIELASGLDTATMDVLLNWIGYKPATDQRVLPPFPEELRQAGLNEALLTDRIGALRRTREGWLSFELL